jgi:hypothetical protein
MTNKRKKKISFLIAGVQKAGTTALDSYLREHTDLIFPKVKELHFFDNEKNFANGSPDYEKYHSSFEIETGNKLMGETTPAYIFWKNAAKRIFDYNANMKFIVLLRNPIHRAFSHWNMQRTRGLERNSFLQSILNDLKQKRFSNSFEKNFSDEDRPFSYVDRGFYSVQINEYLKYFPMNNFLFLKKNGLKNEHQNTINMVFNFLGVKTIPVEKKIIHAGQYGSKLNNKERLFLYEIYKEDIKITEKLLSWDCSEWC